MSEKKLDLILNELQKVNGRLDSQEEMISQLIGIVKSTNEKLKLFHQLPGEILRQSARNR